MDEEIQGAAPDASEVDVDAVLADVEAGREVGGAAPAPEAPAKEEPVWNGQEWEFEWNGKKIVPENPDKLKIWAAQGYNYSQRMGELNKTHAQRLQEAEARELAAKALEQKLSPYSQVDQYAQQNPDWWEHVNRAYQERESHGLDPNLAKIISPLQQKLGAIEQVMEAQKAAQEQAAAETRHREQDQALGAEIESIRKSYPNIDLSARDESGETLEQRVCKHGVEIGTHSFRAAFRDYLFDQLTVQQQAQQKLQAVQKTQANARAGLLGKTPAPTRELKPVDTRRPWNDPQFDVETILEELRQTGG